MKMISGPLRTDEGGRPMFEDREDAGKRLGRALEAYRDEGALVLAIPRGGVEVGYWVARYLKADLAILVARKLPFPDNPEAGFGAIAEEGSTFIFEEASRWLSAAEIERIIRDQEREMKRRIRVLRKGRPLPDISGRTVILVDDGLAMGSTMRAAVKLCRRKRAARIIVAVPVAGADVARDMEGLADETVILEVPPFFRAVAQFYRRWSDVQDEEVLALLEKWARQERKQRS
jgi:putative phosphoribosyl transferase